MERSFFLTYKPLVNLLLKYPKESEQNFENNANHVKATFNFKSHASIIQEIIIIGLISNLPPFEKLLNSKK